MRHAAFEGKVTLRVDVDYPVGLERGVPRLLDALAAAGMQATFFVVAGSNRPARAWTRLARRDYLRRLWRLGPTRIARAFGGTLLGSGKMLEAPAARAVLQRIVAEGHELAIHGHDHAWWAEHVWSAPPAAAEREIERAYAAMRQATGRDDWAWGSPAWRTSDGVLRALEARGVAYFSDCWGSEPFRTLDAREAPIAPPHLPITLPSLEASLLELGLDEARAVERALDGRPRDRYDLLCAHDYFEGLLRPRLFSRLLAGCAERGLRCVTLEQTAHDLVASGAPLPAGRLTRRRVPGFAGEASWQA
ncbi:MAG TPA: polysaccharide deacetylase family protein [Candidatus Polarisedimenticolaceae bacterium]|nr:polysaccharide deacetylase family protein [Candidatus Polarisedimenticolaceae bacterium]